MKPLLKVSGLNAWYGESHILHGVDMTVGEGEMVTLLGRNGVGKTTTLRAIMGIVRERKGEITFAGEDLIRVPLHRVAHRGLGFIPEERGIFSTLSVYENLLLPPAVAEGGMTIDEIFELFPNLHERRNSQGTKLSGGEQQMLAIGRAMMARPELILFDEPSLGLAPLIVKRIFEVLAEIASMGKTIFLVEQNAHHALRLSNRAYVMVNGRIHMSGESASLLDNEDVRKAYLGLH